jgi:nitrous oxide reductase accessory protein NosL
MRTKPSRHLLTCASALLLMLLPACRRTPLTGAPELRLGREECHECGMQVDEDRSSCSLLVDREGERLYVYFDDIGCMLDYDYAEQGKVAVLERFVHDYGTRAWVPALEAVYLQSDRQALRTPMGSGLASFASRPDAEAAQQKFGGELMDLRSLAVARRERIWAEYGKPEGAQPVQIP